MTLKHTLYFLLTSCILISCTEDPDLESPITDIIFPVQGDTLLIDEGLRFVATIEDNISAGQYKLELNGIDRLNGPLADSTISRIFVDDLSDGEFYIERSFSIPDSIFNGHYQISLSAIDNAGNESVADTANFFFFNTNDTVQPTFIDTVVFDTISVIRGGFNVNIDVFDDYLKYVKLEVTEDNGSTTLREVEWLDVNYSWVNILEWYPFDESWPEGDYTIHVLAIDKNGYRDFYSSIYIDQ